MVIIMSDNFIFHLIGQVRKGLCNHTVTGGYIGGV
jgi:hypothetical protein